jgi:serine/threonine protein kinase
VKTEAGQACDASLHPVDVSGAAAPRLAAAVAALRRLDHDALLDTEGVFEVEGDVVVVSRHTDGVTLARCMAEADDPLPTRALLDVAVVVAEALDATSTLPSGSLPRRTLGPHDIWITYTGDVGLHLIAPHGTVDVPPATPLPAPETLRGRPNSPPGPPQDVFALGAMLFGALTGRGYFEGQPETGLRRLAADVARFDAWRTQRLRMIREPAEVTELLTQMLDFQPGRRPSLSQVATALREVSAGLDTAGLRAWAAGLPRADGPERNGPWTNRRLTTSQPVPRRGRVRRHVLVTLAGLVAGYAAGSVVPPAASPAPGGAFERPAAPSSDAPPVRQRLPTE